MLIQQQPDLWIAEKPHRLWGQQIGSRMTVIRLANGELFIHSPVKLTESEHSSLKALGTVSHIVAPNRFHHLGLSAFVRRYPAARFYGAHGLQRKRKDVHFSELLSNLAPPSWRGQIDQHEIEGMPRLNEVVFFHRQSQTLIVTDLVFHLTEFSSPLGVLLAKLNGAYGHFGPTRFFKMLIKNRKKFNSSLRHVLAWDFRRIILSHGELIDTDAKARLEEAFGWALTE